MTTEISLLCPEEEEEDLFEQANVEDQVDFLRIYLQDHPSKAIDLFSHFDRKYRASGVQSLARFLEAVCLDNNFNGDIKLIAADALLSFQEDLEIVEEPHANIKKASNDAVTKRNKIRMTRGVACLRQVLKDIIILDHNLASILKFDAIIKLYTLAKQEENEKEIIEQSILLMKQLVGNHTIEAQYRLKLLTKIPFHDLASECFIYFLGDPGNPTSMRILAAQALLATDKNAPNKSSLYDVVLAQIEIFARDEELDDFIRADAADVLLGYGDDELQQEARTLINRLGRRAGFGLYQNAQNVHAESVDQSIRASLDTLNTWRKKNENKVKSFEDTADNIRTRRNLVEQTIEETRDVETALLRVVMGSRTYGQFTSSTLLCTICAWIEEQEHETQQELWKRFDQELLDMVNTCNTGIVSRLVNVLSGWGGFQIQISFKDQIRSNFAGRLNAVARQLVQDDNHKFYELRKNEVASIYIMDVLKEDQASHVNNNNTDLEMLIADRELDKKIKPVPKIIKTQLTKAQKIKSLEQKYTTLHDDAKQHFIDRLFLEFSISEPNRKCFHLFFGYCFSKISEELREEFKEFVSPDDFQLCVRDALAFYEGA